MPDNILFGDFSAGWIPSDSPIKGRKNGLLQMDNLEMDENGALTLAGGTHVIQSGYAAPAHTLYSNIISGTRHDYAALTNGSVMRDASALTGAGSTTRAAFGTAGKFSLICSGNLRLKDVGSGTPVNLGVKAPTAVITVNGFTFEFTTNALDTTANVILPGGGPATFSGGYIQMDSDVVTGNFACQSYGLGGIPFNWNKIGSSGGIATQNDVLYVAGYNFFPDTDELQIDILLETPNVTGDQVNNYYTIKPNQADYHFDLIGNFHLNLRRGDFTQVGRTALDWGSVFGFRITFTTSRLGATAYIQGSPSSLAFYGGSLAQKGLYEYAQMNVNNTGEYLAKSELGNKSDLISSDMARVKINIQDPTAIDAQVNEVWIFRRAVDGIGLLEQWYRVGVITTGAFGSVYTDKLRDEDALVLNITVNLNLKSILSTSISDPIYDIVGPINGRWYYFTNNYMYPSELNDPDMVDVSIAVRFTGSNNEIFMWARKLAEGIVCIMTSLDARILTGTFSTLPDFSVDIYDRSLSCSFPAISYDVAIWSGTAFYLANDGWRSIDSQGINRNLVAPNTDRLYRNITCQGYTGTNVRISPGAVRFPVCIAGNKMWCFIIGNKRIEVWDFNRQYWRVANFTDAMGDVKAALTTPDGQILACFADNKLRSLDYQTDKLIDGSTSQTFNLLSPVLDHGTARQRKDSYTFKVRGKYTGGNLTATITTDDNILHTLAVIPPSATVVDYFIDLKAYFDKTKTFQIGLSGQVTDATIEDFQVHFDTLPEQLSYLRFRPENYGSNGRKRQYTVPFVIDTLGNDVTLNVRVDGILQPSLLINCNRKETFFYTFQVSFDYDIVKGVDYQYDFSSTGLFEFYGFLPSKNLELLPEPLDYLRAGPENFGTSGLKRTFTIPFTIDTLGNIVNLFPVVDDVQLPTMALVCNRKKTFNYEFVLNTTTNDIVRGVDYIFVFQSLSGYFEWYGFLTPKNIELLPEPEVSYVVPPTNFGSPNKKRLRVWPVIINTHGSNVTFTPIIDGTASVENRTVINTNDFTTVRCFFTTDVFGVDYSASFTGVLSFEMKGMLPPDIVQILPIARRFDQIGPEELFREGQISQFEIRLMAFGGVFGSLVDLPFMIFMQDTSVVSGVLQVMNGCEQSYFVNVPKGVSGSILRFEIGPTSYDFHRFYMRFKVISTGADTEQNWITIPGQG